MTFMLYLQIYAGVVLVNCFCSLFFKFRWKDNQKEFWIMTFHPFIFPAVFVLLCCFDDKDVKKTFPSFKKEVVNREILTSLSKEELVTRLLKEQTKNKMKKKYG